MKGHLLRWRCASAPHVRTQYAPVRWTGRVTRARGILLRADGVGPMRLASGALLRHLLGPVNQLASAPWAQFRFLNGLNWPNTHTGS